LALETEALVALAKKLQLYKTKKKLIQKLWDKT